MIWVLLLLLAFQVISLMYLYVLSKQISNIEDKVYSIYSRR